MSLTCQTLLERHPDTWHRATVHPFLTQCQTGALHPTQFNTWLVQDYRFVVDFTRMLARVLVAAPVAHFDVLLSGLTALQDELNWFRTKATERQLDLATPPQATCQGYCTFLESLAMAPYAVQATALWAIELAYNQGWQLPGPMPSPYTEFAERWGNPGFTTYVGLLADQANQALATESESVQAEAEQVFLQVASWEEAFWQMAFTADR